MGHSYLDNQKIIAAYLAKQITALEKEKLLKKLNNLEKIQKRRHASRSKLPF